MKAKQSLLIAAAMVALALTSCGGGNSSSSKASGENLFGDLPGIYEEKVLSMVNSMKKAQDDTDAMMEALGKIEEAFKKTTEEVQPKVDQMIGKSIAYNVEDGLPYRVISDVKIEKVTLPTFGIRMKPLSVSLSFDIIKDTDERNLYVYFFGMDGDKAILCDSQSTGRSHAKGDTIHVTTSVKAPDIPAKYQEKCRQLKFVTSATYDAQKTAIQEQQEAWGEEERKRLGLD